MFRNLIYIKTHLPNNHWTFVTFEDTIQIMQNEPHKNLLVIANKNKKKSHIGNLSRLILIDTSVSLADLLHECGQWIHVGISEVEDLEMTPTTETIQIHSWISTTMS